MKVLSLRFGTMFKKAFGDHEVFSAFVSDVLGIPIRVKSVQQEFRYPEAVGPINVTYDLFAEDEENRVIVEVQHIRERDFFHRFLHYHNVGIVEQASVERRYEPTKTVFTIVVLTTGPREEKLQFSVAVSDVDPINEKGKRLGVFKHRLVFVNPRDINEDTPKAARQWMQLIADSLSGEVEETDYADPLLQRVIGSIRNKAISPTELAQIIDEDEWERTKRGERAEGWADGRAEGETAGLVKGLRQAVVDLCDLLGIQLSAEKETHLTSLDLADLEALRLHLKTHRTWPV